MKVLLVDNEPVALMMLESILSKNCLEIVSIQSAKSISEAKISIETNPPDIVFLDIELNDGTGFDLINQLEKSNFQLIFVTAFEKYALNAFRISAIDFIHKPIETIDVINAYQKALISIKNRDISKQILILKDSLLKLNSSEQKIVLKDSRSMHFVAIHDIYYCMSDGSYTNFYFSDDKKILVSKPLKEYESLLEPFGFIRTHHSYIVNQTKIIRLDKIEGGYVILDNNKIVPISQRKWDYVIQILEESTK